jgi:hypothetical protein
MQVEVEVEVEVEIEIEDDVDVDVDRIDIGDGDEIDAGVSAAGVAVLFGFRACSRRAISNTAHSPLNTSSQHEVIPPQEQPTNNNDVR